jgi:hypothetical protein
MFSLSPEAVTTGCAQKLQYHCLHPSQLPERERKKTQKTRQRRKKKWRKRRKYKKKKRNHKPAGTAFRSLLSFLHIRSAEQGRRKCRKPEERERNEDCRGEAQKKNANRE